MTGTAYTGTNVVTGKYSPGTVQVALGKYALTGAVVSGDTYTWSSILPTNGITILDFKIYGAELDTDASPTATLKIGDGTDDDGYLTSKTAGDATGQMKFSGDGAFIGKSTGATGATATSNVIGTVGGTVATAATTGTIWIAITYYCYGDV